MIWICTPSQRLAGETHDKLFQRKKEAEDFDLAARTGTAPEVKLDRGERNVSFAVYVERWRVARNIGRALETRRRIESNVRLHLVPEFGNRLVRSITETDVLLWLAQRLGAGIPQSSLRLYFELFDTIMAAAVTDKVIPDNPCDGIKLSQVFRGLSRAPKWVPDEGDVLRLFDAVPERYHALLWLGAGAGLRISEALGFEDGPRCLEFHALRHFFATTLITQHADPKEVQRALRHSTLQITLETYVHFWPRQERRRGVVGDVLRAAADRRDHP
jgi:integrase